MSDIKPILSPAPQLNKQNTEELYAVIEKIENALELLKASAGLN